jgi:hypothetical protein
MNRSIIYPFLARELKKILQIIKKRKKNLKLNTIKKEKCIVNNVEPLWIH